MRLNGKKKLVTIIILTFVFLIIGCSKYTDNSHTKQAKQNTENKINKKNRIISAPAKTTPKTNNHYHSIPVQILATKLSPEQAYQKGVTITQTPNSKNNLNTAIDWIQYSAQGGYAEAQFKLGIMYFQGIGVIVNQVIGFYWIHKAASNNFPQAELYLSYMYRHGMGTVQNLFLANYWSKKAQLDGIPEKYIMPKSFLWYRN